MALAVAASAFGLGEGVWGAGLPPLFLGITETVTVTGGITVFPLLSRVDPLLGLVTLRQTFVRRCQTVRQGGPGGRKEKSGGREEIVQMLKAAAVYRSVVAPLAEGRLASRLRLMCSESAGKRAPSGFRMVMWLGSAATAMSIMSRDMSIAVR